MNTLSSKHYLPYAGWGRRVFRRVTRSISRAAKHAAEAARRAAERAAEEARRAAQRAAEEARRVAERVARAAKEALNAALSEFKKAKNKLKRFKTQLKNAKNTLNRVFHKLKSGLKIFDFLKNIGSGEIISIRKLYFDVSLGTASGGHFAGGIKLVLMQDYKVKTGVKFNIHHIPKLAQQVFRKCVQKLKNVFG